MIRRSIFSLCLLGALVASLGRPAFAGGSLPEGVTQEAARRFEVGVKLFEEGDKRAALIEFERANAIDPNYRVLYNIAQCRLALSEYAGALEAFRRYLAEGGSDVPAARRAQVQGSIDELRNRVGWVRVNTNVDGADLAIDDVVLDRTPVRRSILVSVGRRKVSLAKPGLPTVVRFIDIASRDTVEVQLDFAQGAVVPPHGASPDAVHHSAAPPGRSMVPALVAFGVGAVGLGVGTFFGISALDDKRNLDTSCPSGVCPPSSQWRIDEAQRYAIASTVGFVVGVAGTATGIAYLVWPSSGEHPASRPQTSASLSVGPGSVQVVGSF